MGQKVNESPPPRRLAGTVWTAGLAVSVALATACCGKQTPASPAPPTLPPVAAKTAPAPVAPEPAAMPRMGKTLLQLPHVTLVAVTDWQATLKPCGCTLDLQRGGVERLAHWLQGQRKQDDSVLVVHAGSLLQDEEPHSSPAKLAQLQLRREVFGKALKQLQIAAVALSRWDLAQGGQTVAAAYQTLETAVLTLTPAPGLKTRKSLLIKTASGVQVGLLAVDPADGVEDAARHTLVAAEVQSLRQQGAQLVVALANTGLRAGRKLARQVAGLDVIVVGQLDAKTEPSLDLDREGDVLLMHSTRHGAWAAALTLVPEGGGSWQEASQFLPDQAESLRSRIAVAKKHLEDLKGRASLSIERALPMYQAQLDDLAARLRAAEGAAKLELPAGRLGAYRSVGLDWSAPTDAQVAALVAAYDAEVVKVAEKLASVPVPAKAGQASYIGQAECLGCHESAEPFAKANPHAKAWKTLQDGARTRDLDCVPCHTTGWGQPGGAAFANVMKYKDVQCEACHGPGSFHAADPEQAGLLTPANAKACAPCHSPEHSPRFAFDLYVRQLKVAGHGQPAAAKP